MLPIPWFKLLFSWIAAIVNVILRPGYLVRVTRISKSLQMASTEALKKHSTAKHMKTIFYTGHYST
jgi:hypothetical protein